MPKLCLALWCWRFFFFLKRITHFFTMKYQVVLDLWLSYWLACVCVRELFITWEVMCGWLQIVRDRLLLQVDNKIVLIEKGRCSYSIPFTSCDCNHAEVEQLWMVLINELCPHFECQWWGYISFAQPIHEYTLLCLEILQIGPNWANIFQGRWVLFLSLITISKISIIILGFISLTFFYICI